MPFSLWLLFNAVNKSPKIPFVIRNISVTLTEPFLSKKNNKNQQWDTKKCLCLSWLTSYHLKCPCSPFKYMNSNEETLSGLCCLQPCFTRSLNFIHIFRGSSGLIPRPLWASHTKTLTTLFSMRKVSLQRPPVSWMTDNSLRLSTPESNQVFAEKKHEVQNLALLLKTTPWTHNQLWATLGALC